MQEILLFIFTFMYWTSEGVTEAFTWSNDEQRKNNKIAYDEWRKAHFDEGNGIAGYHTWRNIELLGIFGMIGTFSFDLIWFYAGTTLISWFAYQRMMGITRKNEWFPEKSDYRIGTFLTVPHKPWLDWTVVVIAIVIITGSLV